VGRQTGSGCKTSRVTPGRRVRPYRLCSCFQERDSEVVPSYSTVISLAGRLVRRRTNDRSMRRQQQQPGSICNEEIGFLLVQFVYENECLTIKLSNYHRHRITLKLKHFRVTVKLAYTDRHMYAGWLQKLSLLIDIVIIINRCFTQEHYID